MLLIKKHMDILAQKFLNTWCENYAIDLLRSARCNNFHHIGMLLGNFLEKEYPHSADIKEEYSITLYYGNKSDQAYFASKRYLELRGLSEEQSKRAIFNQHFAISAVKNRYIHYDPIKMRKILNMKKRNFPLVTLTITSCKRYDLFAITINSFVNCCKDFDLIHEWFCVDDNSSDEDRKNMMEFYPFFKFYFKNPEEKGHPQSMNIIRDYVKTPYIFHLEDDWCFFDRRNYISECLEVLGTNIKIGQCLINKNYGEIPSDCDLLGGLFHITNSGLRYYIHEYCSTQQELDNFSKKYGLGKQCAYWPHFSFRPSLLRTNVLNELGSFNEKISHFEMDYCVRYVNRGYISAFLEGIYCIHIGRLTSERNDVTKTNAYELNNEAQFIGKEEQIKNLVSSENIFPFRVKTFVVNLDHRDDRWDKFNKLEEAKFLMYNRFSAINGLNLKKTLQLQQIFDNNDYNMRKGMVGCAMSHIYLYIQLLKDEEADVYCILEDDISIVPDFEDKLSFCAYELAKTEWDLFYLGHHLWTQFIDNEVYSKTLWPKIEQFDRFESMRRSIGGTIGYMINKKGAENLLNFINRTGMTNGIDTVQQKSADELNIYYAYPHLIYSECFRGNNNPDTDIQYNFDSLSMTLEERLEEELNNHYKDGITEIFNIESLPTISPPVSLYFRCDDKVKISNLVLESTIPCYTLDNKILFIPNNDTGQYFHRFKKYGEWNIDDAIQFVS